MREKKKEGMSSVEVQLKTVLELVGWMKLRRFEWMTFYFILLTVFELRIEIQLDWVDDSTIF